MVLSDLRVRPASGGRASPGSRASAAELRTSAAVLAALLVTIGGLHVVLQGLGWWLALAVLCALLLGTAAVVRLLPEAERPGRGNTRRRLLPELAAAIVLVLALTVVFAPSTAILGVIPTTGTWDAFQRLIAAGNLSIARQSLPAIATPAITFLLCLGVGAIAITADTLASAFRTPALAGIPLLVLLAVPGAVSFDITDPIVFVLAALSYLVLLRVNAPGRRTGLTVGLSAAVIVGALLAPALLPDVNPAQPANGTGFSSGVNPVLSLGQNLRQDVERTVLTYSTASGRSEYLRLVSLQNFTGTDWAPDPFRQRNSNIPDAIGAPPGLSTAVATRKDETFVSVMGLATPWLPLPYPTSKVAGLQGDWYWDSDGLAVKSPNRDASNETYRATSLTIEPTPAQLSSAGTSVPAGFGRFLALPPAMPKIIVDTADRVAGGATSNYEKALLLQDFFRNGDFQYSETAPVDQGYDGTGMAVIAAFLTAKQGYCIHFASAMAVMARSLGIPSRIAVGFLPGTQLAEKIDGRTGFTVTSRNLHAWPELYFDGIGWTRFEPTVSRGEVPAYADAASPNVPTPVNTATAAPSAAASARPSVSARPLPTEPGAQGGAPGPSAWSASWFWVLVGILAVALLALGPAVIRSAVRRRRLRDLAAGLAPALTGWREVIDTASDLGVSVPDTDTAREAAELLAAAMGGAPRGPLDRLRSAVEQESYGRAEPSSGAGSIAEPVRDILAALRASAGRRRRLRASLFPPSLWGRILGERRLGGGS